MFEIRRLYKTILHYSIQLYIKWSLSNPDTNGAEESVVVGEVSSFQRLKCGTWGGKRCPGKRCPV